MLRKQGGGIFGDISLIKDVRFRLFQKFFLSVLFNFYGISYFIVIFYKRREPRTPKIKIVRSIYKYMYCEIVL